ncbi:G-type lectin S-receptor-like serine/threonine-protein kinase At4g27290 [Helianthus annuus]|uniref:G-type lectin S-receptor-like serine/threonine-protein kinase At4g27290 n=1 Tax=Helianthus annuus TaxID=4232 RepID=UPI0016531FA2|nr:G-type lectin S-receptor-like serine/threonine-protein kinase At4g27290 [Helianthus annuus]
MFELGFFSPGKSKNRYLGIWYKKISYGTVVWVANRETPIADRSGMLKLTRQGNLVILSGGNTKVWSSDSTLSVRSNIPLVAMAVQLLDTGNLVVWNNNKMIWQSFDYPGDTFLPGIKLGKDLVTGLERSMTSWKSPDDPSIGEYRNILNTNGYPQALRFRGEVLQGRLGPWNGLGFSGYPIEKENQIYFSEFVMNEKEIYHTYALKGSVVQRVVLTWDGKTLLLQWIERIKDWIVYANALIDTCDRFSLCGPYAICSINKYPPCTCMLGFEPRNPEAWEASDWVSGCKRTKPLHCGNGDGDGFLKIAGVKVPDTRRSWYNVSMTLRDCEMACKRNCSCTAYTSLDIRNGGSGCLLWLDELLDTRHYDADQDIYIRMVASELEGKWNVHDEKNTSLQMEQLDDIQCFSLYEVARATSNFSVSNMIGEGGFGPVYKGVLEDGREIAVKRLSETSQQGLDEFKNEVICIAKLQHRNLVKLLGYCVHQNELILIYEYMTNKSLDWFLFDETRSSVLNWPQRFNIIHGIARGILYLHQDSRLQIIHRDLKAGNILLDGDMNPKISDFGLARKFVGHDTSAKTKKVVGTYGYISPEYAVHGRFSIKSDVFSFGVLVLEIISGKKNKEFSHGGHSDNLLGHAWRLYKEGRSIELTSGSLQASRVASEVLRSIHVALLCVQHHAEDRPTMLSVVLMLVSEGPLPEPKTPAFFSEESNRELKSLPSIDARTITLMYGR